MSKLKMRSMIELSTEMVITMAQDTINRIQAKRVQMRENEIQSLIDESVRKANSLWGKMTFKTPLEREDAIRKHENIHEYYDYWWGWDSEDYAWGDLERAERLLEMAKMKPGGTIFVDAEDYRAIA
jgi:hypothetical protein